MRIIFEDAKGITTGDAGVLTGVAREHHTVAGAQSQLNELDHVIEAHGRCFVHDDEAAGREAALRIGIDAG